MPEQKPNQFARIAAVLTLGVAFIAVIATLATSGGEGDKDGEGDATTADGPTAKGQRALDKGVWVVGEGDTLVSIAEETGVDLDELIELNPEIDPQVLATGQRISLTQSLGGDGSSSGSGTITEGAGIGDGTGEGDGGPTGTGEAGN